MAAAPWLAACSALGPDDARAKYVEQNRALLDELPPYEGATVASTHDEKYDGSRGSGYRTTRVVRFAANKTPSELANEADSALAAGGWSCAMFTDEPSKLGTDGRGVRCSRGKAELVAVYYRLAGDQRRASVTVDHDNRLAIE